MLKQKLTQKFDNCNEATIYVKSHDLLAGIGVFYKLNIKKTTVLCNETQKIINKKHWNKETQDIANTLKEQLILKKGGWYFMLILVLVGLFSAIFAIYQGTVETEIYNKSYISKSRVEKQALRAKMNKGDFMRTLNNIYTITLVEENSITVSKSTVKPIANVNKEITASLYKNSFSKTSEIKINRKSFIENGSVNTNFESVIGGDNVFQILDVD